MSKIYIITRHVAAVEWLSAHAEELGFTNASEMVLLSHLDDRQMSAIQEEDAVIGILPLSLIAAVCAKGAKFYSLDMTVPAEARGKELSVTDMETYGAALTPYYVKVLD
jgi:CRISPR-associated protein Csx16